MVDECERRLTEAFERWLAKQSREKLERVIREIWYQQSWLRIAALPYHEIVEEAKKVRG
jgi:hypothetical protein